MLGRLNAQSFDPCRCDLCEPTSFGNCPDGFSCPDYLCVFRNTCTSCFVDRSILCPCPDGSLVVPQGCFDTDQCGPDFFCFDCVFGPGTPAILKDNSSSTNNDVSGQSGIGFSVGIDSKCSKVPCGFKILFGSLSLAEKFRLWQKGIKLYQDPGTGSANDNNGRAVRKQPAN